LQAIYVEHADEPLLEAYGKDRTVERRPAIPTGEKTLVDLRWGKRTREEADSMEQAEKARRLLKINLEGREEVFLEALTGSHPGFETLAVDFQQGAARVVRGEVVQERLSDVLGDDGSPQSGLHGEQADLFLCRRGEGAALRLRYFEASFPLLESGRCLGRCLGSCLGSGAGGQPQLSGSDSTPRPRPLACFSLPSGAGLVELPQELAVARRTGNSVGGLQNSVDPDFGADIETDSFPGSERDLVFDAEVAGVFHADIQGSVVESKGHGPSPPHEVVGDKLPGFLGNLIEVSCLDLGQASLLSESGKQLLLGDDPHFQEARAQPPAFAPLEGQTTMELVAGQRTLQLEDFSESQISHARSQEGFQTIGFKVFDEQGSRCELLEAP